MTAATIKEIPGPVEGPTAEEAAWAALCVFRYVAGRNDRKELLDMLGLAGGAA